MFEHRVHTQSTLDDFATHYLGDKQDFDVSSEGPASEVEGSSSSTRPLVLIPDEGISLETSKSCLSPR